MCGAASRSAWLQQNKTSQRAISLHFKLPYAWNSGSYHLEQEEKRSMLAFGSCEAKRCCGAWTPLDIAGARH